MANKGRGKSKRKVRAKFKPKTSSTSTVVYSTKGPEDEIKVVDESGVRTEKRVRNLAMDRKVVKAHNQAIKRKEAGRYVW